MGHQQLQRALLVLAEWHAEGNHKAAPAARKPIDRWNEQPLCRARCGAVVACQLLAQIVELRERGRRVVGNDQAAHDHVVAGLGGLAQQHIVRGQVVGAERRLDASDLLA